jgi:hypothetical protein
LSRGPRHGRGGKIAQLLANQKISSRQLIEQALAAIKDDSDTRFKRR